MANKRQNQRQKQQELIQRLPVVESDLEHEAYIIGSALKELISEITKENISDRRKEILSEDIKALIESSIFQYKTDKNPYLVRIFNIDKNKAGEFYLNITKYEPRDIRKILEINRNQNSEYSFPNFEMMIDKIRPKKENIIKSAYNMFINIINNGSYNMETDKDYISLKQSGL